MTDQTPIREVWCGPCNDGICESMGCSLPGPCSCPEAHSPADTEIDLTDPTALGREVEKDDEGPDEFTFVTNGQTYVLPLPTEDAAESVPFGVTKRLMVNPKDPQAQIALGMAMLDHLGASEAAIDALDAMPTKEALEKVVGPWLGGSQGSSDSSQGTEGP